MIWAGIGIGAVTASAAAVVVFYYMFKDMWG